MTRCEYAVVESLTREVPPPSNADGLQMHVGTLSQHECGFCKRGAGFTTLVLSASVVVLASSVVGSTGRPQHSQDLHSNLEQKPYTQRVFVIWF